MSFETVVLNNLKKYKVLAIVGVFLSFFIVVGLLNYFQRVTLEGFVTLNQANKLVENFGGCGNQGNHGNQANKLVENFGGCGNHRNKTNQ